MFNYYFYSLVFPRLLKLLISSWIWCGKLQFSKYLSTLDKFSKLISYICWGIGLFFFFSIKFFSLWEEGKSGDSYSAILLTSPLLDYIFDTLLYLYFQFYNLCCFSFYCILHSFWIEKLEPYLIHLQPSLFFNMYI